MQNISSRVDKIENRLNVGEDPTIKDVRKEARAGKG
jgi:hypothetical protein